MNQTQQPLLFSSEYWIKETLEFLSKKEVKNKGEKHKQIYIKNYIKK